MWYFLRGGVWKDDSRSGNFNEIALKLFDAIVLRSLRILGKALGPEHPQVATALNKRAVLLESQGEVREGAAAIRPQAASPEEGARAGAPANGEGAE